MAYDIVTQKPLLSRVYPGGTLDKTAVADLIINRSFSNVLFIVDRGFYSKSNLEMFSSNGNKYIIPLMDSLTDYKEVTKNLTLNDRFLYETSKDNRVIEYKEIIKGDTKLIVYRDLKQMAIDDSEALKCLKKEVKGLTVEKYEKIRPYFGIIVLQTNLGTSAQKIYEDYKSCRKIETFYDYAKNEFEFEALHIHVYHQMQGISFILLIVGLIHDCFSNKAKNTKYNINELIQQARTITIAKSSAYWQVRNVDKEHQAEFDGLGVEVKTNMKF